MTSEDLKALRNPLLALTVIVAVTAGAVYYTQQLVRGAELDLKRQQGELRAASTRLQRSGDEKEVIARYVGAYRQLQSRGFVGEEQRINWLDALRQANQQVDLFGVNYQISTQKPYAYQAELNAAPVQLRESVMSLKFQLLHEGDLLRFLSVLEQQGGGIYTVDQCSMKRIDNRGVIRYQPNLAAQCDLAWITASVVAPGEKKP